MCLSPLFALNFNVIPGDDLGVFNTVSDLRALGCSTLIAPFSVIIIPAADLFLDLPANISSYFDDNKSSPSSVVARLNDIERLVFIIGVCIQSSALFFAASADPSTLTSVYIATGNASVVLVLGPVLTYLQRCTTTFTAWRVTSIMIISMMGLLILNICHLTISDSVHFRALCLAGLSIVVVSEVIFISLVAFCAYKYCSLKLKTASDRQAVLQWTLTLFDWPSQASRNSRDKSKDRDYELYTNYIPALHMAAALTVILSEAYIRASTRDLATAYERRNYIMIAAEVCVLLIELRIRKNEIARGLVCIASPTVLKLIMRLFLAFVTTDRILTSYFTLHLYS